MTNDDEPPPPDEEEPPAARLEIPPHDAEAERDLAGAVLGDGDLYDRVRLKSEDFYIHRYRWLWEAYEAIRADGDAIDFLTVCRYLKKAGRWEELNARQSLAAYVVMDWQHVEANARRIREMARRRRMVAEAQALVQRACDPGIPLPPEPGYARLRWNGPELAAADFPEPAGPIPGIIPAGLTVLGGRPKRGKSWLMLQAGCSLAGGGRFLELELQPCRVLYYALEDPPRRLKGRIARLGLDPVPPIDFELAIQPLERGGLAQVEQAVQADGYQVVILDTIRRAMPGRDFNKDGALFDEMLGKLQQTAQQNNAAIVCILHTRKSAAGFDPDPVDDVLGSTGLTASADCVLALYTEQGKKGATLKGRGRDLDDIDLALHFDPLTCCWQSLGDSSEVRISEEEEEIILALKDLGISKVSSIAKEIHKDRGNTSRRCASLWVQGKIRKQEVNGITHYYVPTQATQATQGTQDTQGTQTQQALQISLPV